MADAFQSYINMVTGVTKTTQEKASATARALLKQAGLEDVAAEASERAAKLAEEIMNASRTNRELMQHYVTAEVDKAAARLGFARADEVQALRDEVASLRAQLDEARAANEARMYEARAAAEKTASAQKASAKKAPAKKAQAKRTAAQKASAKRTAAKKAPAKKAPAKKAAAASSTKKAAAASSTKKAAATKSAGRKPPRKTAATAESVSSGEK